LVLDLQEVAAQADILAQVDMVPEDNEKQDLLLLLKVIAEIVQPMIVAAVAVAAQDIQAMLLEFLQALEAAVSDCMVKVPQEPAA
jgi:hypothetical protein